MFSRKKIEKKAKEILEKCIQICAFTNANDCLSACSTFAEADEETYYAEFRKDVYGMVINLAQEMFAGDDVADRIKYLDYSLKEKHDADLSLAPSSAYILLVNAISGKKPGSSTLKDASNIDAFAYSVFSTAIQYFKENPSELVKKSDDENNEAEQDVNIAGGNVADDDDPEKATLFTAERLLFEEIGKLDINAIGMPDSDLFSLCHSAVNLYVTKKLPLVKDKFNTLENYYAVAFTITGYDFDIDTVIKSANNFYPNMVNYYDSIPEKDKENNELLVPWIIATMICGELGVGKATQEAISLVHKLTAFLDDEFA